MKGSVSELGMNSLDHSGGSSPTSFLMLIIHILVVVF